MWARLPSTPYLRIARCWINFDRPQTSEFEKYLPDIVGMLRKFAAPGMTSLCT
jgi:hypothetical protein